MFEFNIDAEHSHTIYFYRGISELQIQVFVSHFKALNNNNDKLKAQFLQSFNFTPYQRHWQQC